MSAIAKTFESSNPGDASSINFNHGRAHKALGREGGIEEATLYFKTTIELAKQVGDNEFHTKGVLYLSECYVEMDRVDEAKSLCDEIGKESMDPEAILEFAEEFGVNSVRALTILEEYLEVIESS